ncbi:MAG: DUF805 domain-containing protein [Terriglobales bacterium]
MATFKEIKSIFWSSGGRINRRRFCLAFLPLFFVVLIGIPITEEFAHEADAAESVMSRQHGELLPLVVAFFLFMSLELIAFVSGICLQVKRFHDFGFSGWYGLLGFIPVANFAVLLVLLFFPGTPGPNRFGDSGDG